MHTITIDNNKGIDNQMKVSNILSVKTYFTIPYTNQDKGTVQNRIGGQLRIFPPIKRP